MRVALLTNFIPPYRIPLYEAMAREAGELRVFVSTNMEANRPWQPQSGKLDVAVQRTITMRRVWRTRDFQEAYELHIPYDTITQLKRWDPDLILTGEMGARSLQAVAFARGTRRPVVLWAMLSDRLERDRGWLRTNVRRWLIKQVDTIVVNGEQGARYFHRMGVADDRLLRVQQSIDMSAFMSLALDRPAEGTLELLYVGSVSERKGVGPLFDALEIFAAAHPDRAIAMTLVGEGPLRAPLAARTLPPNVRVHWSGPVEYDQLPCWYARGDVLVFPTLGDEWGLVVNEALAAGVPVCGSAYSQAVEELIEDGVNGWIFQPDDPRAIVAAIERVANTPNVELQRMRIAARQSIRALTPAAAASRIVARLRALQSC